MQKHLWLAILPSIGIVLFLVCFKAEQQTQSPPKATTSNDVVAFADSEISKPRKPKKISSTPQQLHEVSKGLFACSSDACDVVISAGKGLLIENNRLASGQLKPTFGMQLARIERGEELLYNRSQDLAPNGKRAELDPQNGLSFSWTPEISQRYLSIQNGVELFYDLENAPPGNGDLTFVHTLSSEGLIPVPQRENVAGIFFKDQNGASAFHIGTVVARDARGLVFTAPPTLWRDNEVHLTVSGSWLSMATYPVVIDPPIVITPQFNVNVEQSFPTAPTVAASSDQFLVMYLDFLGSKRRQGLVARIIQPGGVMLPPVQVSPTGVKSRPLGVGIRRVQVASDGSRFLTVWAEHKGGIYGAIVQADGTLLDIDGAGTTSFLISETTGKVASEQPLVAFNGDRFIVAWHDRIEKKIKNQVLFFSFVSTDGSLITSKARMGSLNTVAAGQLMLFLQPGPDQMTLAVVRELNERPVRFRAQRIDKDGNILDPEGIVMFQSEQEEFGFGVPMGIAPNGSLGWQLLSSQAQVLDSVIYLHYLGKDGSITRADQVLPATGGIFTTIGLGPTNLGIEDFFSTTWMGTDLDLPGGGTGGEWLFVRNSVVDKKEIHLLGKRVSFDGTDFDVTPFQIDDSNPELRRSAAAAAATGPSQFLVTWLSGGALSNGRGTGIQAALLDSAGDGDLTSFTEATLTVTSQTLPVSIATGTEITFDWTGSSGPITEQTFFFGDGQALDIPVGTFTATHTYKNPGIFIGRIRLKNGNYASTASIRITVGKGNGLPGADATVGSNPLFTNSAETNPDLSIQSAGILLDLTSTTTPNDRVSIHGLLNPGKLPETAAGVTSTGKTVEVTVFGPANPVGIDPAGFDDAAPAGVKTFTFNLDAGYSFHSTDGVGGQELDFAIDPTRGTYSFEASGTKLASFLVPDEATHKNPSHDRRLRFGLKINGVDFGLVNVVTLYASTAGDSAAGVYFSNGTGKEETGSLIITKTTITEAGGLHNITLSGRLLKPGGLVAPEGSPFDLPLTGTWRFRVGDFVSQEFDIPSLIAARKIRKNAKLILLRGTTKGGLRQFRIDFSRGTFTLQFSAIADVGLPLANGDTPFDLGVLADLYVGFDLDLDTGNFTLGNFTRIRRSDARSGSWSLPGVPIVKKRR